MPVSVPEIVASGSFVGFTGNLASTTIFTPSADGFFNFLLYSESAGSFGSPSISYTDDYGVVSINLTTALFNAGRGPAAYPVRLKSGTSLSLSFMGARPTDISSLYYVVESLA